MQIVDLCHILRDETFLRTIGEQIGQEITIDNSDAYRAKLCGPQVRLLVKDLNTLPHTIVVPRLDGEGVVEYTLEYSGLPTNAVTAGQGITKFVIIPRRSTKLGEGDKRIHSHNARGRHLKPIHTMGRRSR